MARHRGKLSALLMGDESTYGTPPGSNWRRMPFFTEDVGATAALMPAQELGVGTGREEADPYLDPQEVGGSVVVPVDVRNFGYWLRMLLGSPSTSGASNPYTHTWAAGTATALPSRSLEKQFASATTTGKYAVVDGLKADTCELTWELGQQVPRATIGLIGRRELYASSTAGGTPTSLALVRYMQRQATITRAASAIPSLVRATWRYSNGLDPVTTLNSASLVEGIDEGGISITGDVTVRHDDPAIMVQSLAESSAALVLSWVYDASWSLVITMPTARFGRPKIGTSGPDGIEVTYPYRATSAGTAGDSCSVVLKSSVATY